jgi:GT2 family glycosyltransferase
LSDKWEASLEKGDGTYITASNFSIMKDTYLEIGGFRPGLRDGEDYDLAMRAIRKGYRPRFVLGMRAGHLIKGSLLEYAIRYQSYLSASDELPEPISVNPKKFSVRFVIFLVARFFPAKYFFTALLYEHYLYLPRRLRFRLYDFIITYFRQLSLLRP